ncbi:hypothetical protein [Chitinophaga vietnamensis]|uniref:hypothetical protein n=1 Tax=Chitinophaga vietnamensis TaxID=2593957 RepID=UPI001177E0DD|nr:hypothetical protein [Chitinophaga vietnamensis]
MKTKATTLTTEIKDKLYQWNMYSEEELETLVAAFEKIPREAVSSAYVSLLADDVLAEKLVEIGRAYEKNTNLLCNIISALGNMMKRYSLRPRRHIFDFFVAATKNKKANFYVSLFLSSFPQYNQWNGRWGYLTSMASIAPRKKSITNFHTEIKRVVKHHNDDIPSDTRIQIVRILDTYRKSGVLNEDDQKDYLNTLYLLVD